MNKIFSSRNAARGGNWAFELFFYSSNGASEETHSRQITTFSNEDLPNTMLDAVDFEERIKWVGKYNRPLIKIQLTKFYFKHCFIMLETDKNWWSVEKNDKKLILQRSSKLRDVRDRIKGEDRLTGIRGAYSNV